eukprot:GSChrysophyteH1.ASY1.ANO1.2362.1 assembled CDS
MSRDQRAVDNHAIVYAQGLAQAQGVPLKVVFNLVPKFLDATIRQFGFMLKGLEEVESNLRAAKIPFYLTSGDPCKSIPKFCTRLQLPMIQVDAHNIVPVWHASPKLEYGARTIRSKINAVISTYLRDDMPPLSSNIDADKVMSACKPVDWKAALKSLEINREIKEVDWITPGTAAARKMLESFCETKLIHFADKRNDPNTLVASEMSPYYHFGQFSVQRAILHIKSLRRYSEGTASYCEEAVIRRELSDNFCFYNPNYDNLDGIYPWAKESLDLHKADVRNPLYTRDQLEAAETIDDLWNAAQLQMVQIGKMHGFLRMYWAKKILEWTASPEEALATSIYLNDKYSLDGRDPNGYVGCMWSIGGVHDQGWMERSIFGKIRYMNYAGCKRKFDVAKFVQKYPPASIPMAKIF